MRYRTEIHKHSYDALDRLTTIQSAFTYSYTGVNPLIQSLTRPNGSITEYLYNDPLKRLTEITNKTSANAIINKYVFTYNNHDLIGTETITTGTPLDSFTAGIKTYDYNKVNQLLSSTNPSEAFAYDDDGNMTQGYTPEGYQFTATYDAENRLKSTQYTDSGSIVHRTEYFYGGDSVLAQTKKFENGVLADDARYIRNGFLPVQERDGSNSVLRDYTWGLNLGGGIGGLLNLKQSGQNYNYLYDGKGNVSALIDSSQNLVASYRYDVFGKMLKKTGPLDQPYRFSTKQYDEQSGQYNYGYRFYNPVTGTWMTRDPLGEAGGINLYNFVGNNPVNFVDPLGLRCTYSQSTGHMTCWNDEGDGQVYYHDTGYSGTGSGRNNPNMQNVTNVGPIPQGSWLTGSPYNSPNTGKNTIPLTALLGNQCFNTERDCASFRAHGNNARNDASHGCIVLPPNRTQIPRGEIVDVVP